MRLPERPGRRRDREPDITGNRAYSGHIPGIFRAYSGHIRTREDRRMPYRLSSDRVPSGSSRAGAPVAGHGVEKGCRVRYRSAWGMGVACRMARRRIACRMARRRIASRCVPARVGDLDVPAVFTVWHPEGPSSAMSRPNSACSRRRHRRFTNMYSFTWPWRSITIQSAARLRRALGRPHPVTRSPDGHAPIFIDGYQSAGKPAIPTAQAER